MPVKVTKEEKMVELAILKAKEFLQHAGHLGTVELEDDSEDVKVKRPTENPKENKLDNPTGDGYGEVSGDAYHKSAKYIEMINLFEQVVKEYGGKYSDLTDESNPMLDAEFREGESRVYAQSLKDLENLIQALKTTTNPNQIRSLAQRAYEATRDMLEMDMGTAAPPRGSISPPKP
tara:strand:- start:14373 stop:14900 length:528 start_codon:yes stop_codon:yes gene_type:complete